MSDVVQVFLIDARVAERTNLLAGVTGPIVCHDVAIDADPIAAITQALAGTLAPVTRLVLIAHGAAGCVQLGTGVTVERLLDASAAVRGWQQWLSADATIQILACDAAQGASGRQLVHTLAHLSGRAVAAAEHTLGHRDLGGDWCLTVSTAGADTDCPLSEPAMASWRGTLSWSSSVPTAGNDTFTGDANNNYADGSGGDDLLLGANGDDTLVGNLGHDTLDGGDGNDSMEGGAGADSLVSSTGIDSVLGGDDDDIILINSSGDLVSGELYDGGIGVDTARFAYAQAYNLTLGTWSNFEHLQMLTGGATLVGSGALFASVSSITGGGGTDYLSITGGAADLSSVVLTSIERITLGNATQLTINPVVTSNFVVQGSAQNDVISLGGGADSIEAGNGTDTINAGGGDDTIVVQGAALGSGEIIDGGSGFDFVNFNVVNNVIMSGNNVTVGSSYGSLANIERISGNVGADILHAVAGFGRYMAGSTGNDTLVGNTGADTLQGDAGADSMVGGDGDDLFLVQSGTDLTGDVIDGGAGNDTLRLVAAGAINLTSNVIGGIEHLEVSGGAGGNVTLGAAFVGGLTSLTGGGGIDTFIVNGSFDLTGKVVTGIEAFTVGNGASGTLDASFTGAVTLNGGSLNETIIGGAGADTFIGSAGVDSLTGGAGADVFWYNSISNAADIITDFSIGDKLTIAGATFSSVSAGNGTAMPGMGIQVEINAPNTLLHIDVNNDGVADAVVTLSGSLGVNELSLSGGSLTRITPPQPLVSTISGTTLTLSGTLTAPAIATLNASGVATTTHNGFGVAPTGGTNTGLTTVTATALLGLGANITGNDSNNTINGSAQADSLNGASGNDSLAGDSGADSLIGGLGVDTVLGGAGADTIGLFPGDAANSELYDGGADTDTMILYGGGGYDFSAATVNNIESVIGSSGNDTLVLTLTQVTAFTGTNGIDLGAGSDLLVINGTYASINAATYTLAGVEALRFNPNSASSITARPGAVTEVPVGNTFSHTITGTTSPDVVFGGGGGDTIHGDQGADTLVGDLGDDSLLGGLGADVMFGGDGADTLEGGTGTDTMLGGAGNDRLVATGAGGEVLLGNAGNDALFGGSGTGGVILVGDDASSLAGGNDTVVGSHGPDTIFGNGGDDWLVGGLGNDLILGGSGNDTIDANGADTIWTGSGLDRVMLIDQAVTVLITDFTVGQDRLIFTGGLSSIGTNASALTQVTVSGGLQITAGSLTIQLAGVTAPLTNTDLM
ncbi:MAG: DUF4347 domain-containing protein [Alphaproteobacteria bacterium]|nr:DUF4347 domain-containing protein [Alphaproteobacteria bacterium]